MQVDLFTSENVMKFVSESEWWASDALFALCCTLAVLAAVLTICDLLSHNIDLCDKIICGRNVAAAGAAVCLVFAIGISAIAAYDAFAELRDSTFSQIEEGYGIELTASDRKDIKNAISSKPHKVKDANGDRRDPAVEPAALTEAWVETDNGLAPRQYYFMVSDRTDSTIHFELLEPSADGTEWVKVEPKNTDNS